MATASPVICSVHGCGTPSRRRGWCNKHYKRWQRWGDPALGSDKARNGALMEFLHGVVAADTDECIAWPFRSNTKGYGVAEYGGVITLASRIVCILAHGNPPSDTHQSAHSCGNGRRGCVNPKHLSWKTPGENASDKLLHGTILQGQGQPGAKLSAAQVKAIRGSGSRTTDLATEYGVSRALIYKIKNRLAWKFVD